MNIEVKCIPKWVFILNIMGSLEGDEVQLALQGSSSIIAGETVYTFSGPFVIKDSNKVRLLGAREVFRVSLYPFQLSLNWNRFL